MNDNMLMFFLGAVFLTVFLLSQVLILPTFGTNKAQKDKLKHRLDNLLSYRGNTHQQLLKQQYFNQLGPFARWVESRAIMIKLKLFLEQAGKTLPAYKFMIWLIVFSVCMATFAWKYSNSPLVSIGVFVIALYLPFFWLQKKRNKNLNLFEEQLPEALQMMARSLKTGYPFNDCLKIVAEEMPDPIGNEFSLIFDEINYGRDLEIAFALLLERIPSLSLSAMATSVLIQKETGGNMSEILLKISDVLRGRFKLQRKVKTVSAEGIFSAWVLCLTPFVMYLALNFINPDHFKAVIEHPDGMNLFYAIAILEVIAIFWMSKIVNIDV